MLPSVHGHGSVVRDKARGEIQSVKERPAGGWGEKVKEAMASEIQGVPTYPVWVGNLKETVKEKDLKRVFSKHGQIASCKVMVDEAGNSK